MLIFDLAGRVYTASAFVTVKKCGDIIVLEFLNNAFIPILAVRNGAGYDCIIYKHKLFRCPVDYTDAISVNISYDSFTSEFGCSFDAGQPFDGTMVRACCDGSVVIRYSTRVAQFQFEDLKNFAASYGAKAPLGCGAAKAWWHSTGGYDIDTSEKSIVVCFPNGMKFPMVDYGNGLRLVKSDLGFHVSDIHAMFIRELVMTDSSVRFNLVVERQGRFTTYSNIKYTKKVAMYNGESLGTVEFTKWLFLRG